MQWAAQSASSAIHRPAYLAPTALSATIQTVTANGVGSSEVQVLNAPGTTLTFPAPVGLDTFLIQTYDEKNAQGNVLSIAEVTRTVAAGATSINVVSSILNGVIASLSASIKYAGSATSFVGGTASTATITVTAYDADGNAILETVAGSTSSFNTPIHVAIVTSYAGDSAAFSLSSSLLQTTSTTPPSTTLNYNGNALLGTTTVTASATGAPTASVPIAQIAGVTTLAGNGTPGLVNNADPLSAEFYNPAGMAVDGSGNIYVADAGNNVIREINSSGVTTFAGNGTAGNVWNVPLLQAEFNQPLGVAFGSTGILYIADYGNSYVKEATPGGLVKTFASKMPALVITLGIAPNGNVIVALNCEIYEYSQAGANLPTIGSTTCGYVNGTGSAASFWNPNGVAIDASGNVYVADYSNNAIREIDPSYNVTTYAGSLSGFSGFFNGMGTAAEFNGPTGVALDGADNLYVSDWANNAVRKIDASGNVTTLAGTGASGFRNGSGQTATFSHPNGVTVDASGNVYVADYGNNAIRKIVP